MAMGDRLKIKNLLLLPTVFTDETDESDTPQVFLLKHFFPFDNFLQEFGSTGLQPE